MTAVIPLDHPRFDHVEVEVFTRKLVADCMTHACTCVLEDNRQMNDACCQYGVDVTFDERDKILAHADAIRPVLTVDQAWFGTEVEEDPDVPGGKVLRTSVANGGCVFLSHDKRGCAIHRVSIEQGWDFREIKPHICRLFPLTYTEGGICIADDYADYSCAFDPSAPSLYRVQRSALADVFGEELVIAMDAAEAKVLARHLPLAQ